MAEPVAEPLAEPLLLRADQAEPSYNAAVQAAVAACAADTAGQTCYICLGPGDEGEGLVRGCACRGTAGFAHVSCLARQAQITVERDHGLRWVRWSTCNLCKQQYHGVVLCALGWACWKTYVGRPEGNWLRRGAINLLGNGLHDADHHQDALSVREAELSLKRRLNAPEESILIVQANLASSYEHVGRTEEALSLQRDVYLGFQRLSSSFGEECLETLVVATNYARDLLDLRRFEEAKSLLRKNVPVARRVLGESNQITLAMRWDYAAALYLDDSSTPDDLREAVATLEDAGRTARRVFGGAHPTATGIPLCLQDARAVLRAREEAAPDDVSSVCEGVAAMTPPGDS